MNMFNIDYVNKGNATQEEITIEDSKFRVDSFYSGGYFTISDGVAEINMNTNEFNELFNMMVLMKQEANI